MRLSWKWLVDEFDRISLININCKSQSVEGIKYVNAPFTCLSVAGLFRFYVR